MPTVFFSSACRHITGCNPDISPPDTGSEERAQPSSEPRRSDTSSATPAESSLLKEPCPGRSHATPQSRTPSTIQREALSPGTDQSPSSSNSSVLLLSLSLFLCFLLSFPPSLSLSFFLPFCLSSLNLFSQLMLLE